VRKRELRTKEEFGVKNEPVEVKIRYSFFFSSWAIFVLRTFFKKFVKNFYF